MFFKALTLFFLFFLAGAFFVSLYFPANAARRVSVPEVGAEYLVKFKSGWSEADHVASFDHLLKTVGGAGLDAMNVGSSTTLRNMVRVKLDDSRQSNYFFALASSLPFVESVTANAVYRPLFIPNDSLYSQQWHFETIHMREAWDADTAAPLYGGDPSVIVAVIDTGVAFENYGSFVQAPDLAGTSFAVGYDFADNDAHPNDDNGHGTHIAGTIAQTTNNAAGVAGIAFHTSIMPIRVCNPLCLTSALAQGVLYAKNNGAKVINISLGGETADLILLAAIQEVTAAGVVVVGGVGNGGIDGIGDPAIYYPAAYSEVIAVGATRFDNTKPAYSNYGDGLDLAAPGGDGSVDQNSDGNPDGILQQTFPGMCETGSPSNTTTFVYAHCQGTSMATPHVTGVAALLFAAGYSAKDIPQILKTTAYDLGASGYDIVYGNGLLNAQAALSTPLSGTIAVSGATNTTQQFANLAITAFGAKGAIEMSFSNNNALWSPWEPFSATKVWDVFDPVYGGATTDSSAIIYGRLRDANGRESSVFFTSTTIDAVAPTVTILGRNPVLVIQGKTYADAGAQASDNLDGNITSRIQTSSTVNTAVHGTYAVTYTIVDSSGNRVEKIRTVFVDEPLIVAGPKRGGGPQVRIFSAVTGSLVSQFMAFETTMKSGLNVAMGDIDGDNQREIITASREGGSPSVRVFDLFGKAKGWNFDPYGKNFHGGISIAVGDLEGDGRSEIIVAPMSGGGPLVQIFGLRNNKIIPVTKSFLAYEKNTRDGVSLSLGDLNGDGASEIVAAPLNQKAPQIRVFGLRNKIYAPILPGSAAFGSGFNGGVVTTVGDFNGDGRNEIAAGVASGGAGQIRFFGIPKNKAALVLMNPGFFAFNRTIKNGLSIAAHDVDGDGLDDIIAGQGGGGSTIRAFNQKGKRLMDEFLAYSLYFKGGITVAAGYRR